jgi:hypothetical protein
MGTVMSVSLQAHLSQPGQLASREVSSVQLAQLRQHPDALIDPLQRMHLPHDVLLILQEALADALHRVFVVGLIVAVLALAAAFLVPKGKAQEHAVRNAE